MLSFLRIAIQTQLLLLHINGFKKNEGRYPDSLKELEQYIIQKGFKRLSFIEYYSNPKGNSREFDVLNGEGGWYYDNATGEVKIKHR